MIGFRQFVFLQENNNKLLNYNDLINEIIVAIIGSNELTRDWMYDITNFVPPDIQEDVIQELLTDIIFDKSSPNNINNYTTADGNFLAYWLKIVNRSKKQVMKKLKFTGRQSDLIDYATNTGIIATGQGDWVADMTYEEKREDLVFQYLRHNAGSQFQLMVKFFKNKGMKVSELVQHIKSLNNKGLIDYPLPIRYLDDEEKILRYLQSGLTSADIASNNYGFRSQEIEAIISSIRKKGLYSGAIVKAKIKNGNTLCGYPLCKNTATRSDERFGDVCDKHRDMLRYRRAKGLPEVQKKTTLKDQICVFPGCEREGFTNDKELGILCKRHTKLVARHRK